VQYNFCMPTSRAISAHFIKYFCDTYFKYITPCTVMTYATPDTIWAVPPWLRTLRSRAMIWTNRMDNTTDNFARKNWLTFYGILPIIHAYNEGRSRLRSYARLWSHARLRSEDRTPVALPDSGGHHNIGRIS
jgi:hypothetical protein